MVELVVKQFNTYVNGLPIIQKQKIFQWDQLIEENLFFYIKNKYVDYLNISNIITKIKSKIAFYFYLVQ